MQVMITLGTLARTRVLTLRRWQLLAGALAVLGLLTVLSGTVYHFVFMKAARDGWPVVGSFVRLVLHDEVQQQERYMRDNLAAMAQRVGEMQAKLLQLQAVSERVSGLAGVQAEELLPAEEPAAAPAQAEEPAPATARGPAGASGGPYLPVPGPSLAMLESSLGRLDEGADWQTDLLTLAESRLSEAKLAGLLVPSIMPVAVDPGSGFGFRRDPFTSRLALHNGLDFPADPGTPVLAAAGGIVSARELHPAYGHLVEIDHGNGLVTRYAHNQRIDVELGALVKRGQQIARVGNSGRSTGPHLHFEVRLDGMPQDPARFLPGMTPARPRLAASGLPRR